MSPTEHQTQPLKVSAIYKNERQNPREHTQPGQLYTGHVQSVHQVCSVRPRWADLSRDGNTRVLMPATRITSLAETLHHTHQPFRAALCSSSKAIYALTFSWCLLGSHMTWRRKTSSLHVLQPVADVYNPAPALSFISWLFPKALIQTSSSFQQTFLQSMIKSNKLGDKHLNASLNCNKADQRLWQGHDFHRS